MISAPDFKTLITKLERSDSGSRELDAEIDQLVSGWANPRTAVHVDTGEAFVLPTVPAYSTSLDAAVALVNRLLPGWSWRVANCSVSDDAWLLPDFNCPIHGERLRSELRQDIDWTDITDVDLRPSGRPALALCISLLVAIEAVHEGTYKAPQAPAAKAGAEVRTIGKTEPSVESGANRTSSLEKDEAEIALRALSKDTDHDHK